MLWFAMHATETYLAYAVKRAFDDGTVNQKIV